MDLHHKAEKKSSSFSLMRNRGVFARMVRDTSMLKAIIMYRSLLIIFLSLAASLSHARLARLDLATGSQPAESVYIELLDTAAPATVNNFLAYVENSAGQRRYDNTFVHRLSTGFVLQMGGYHYDPAAGSFETTGVSHIPEDPPVVNEFSPDRSNVRGTIAMAKLAGNPDSATSEWFINLADNSANLDAQNGGFTVFARVLGNGMDLIDTIASLSQLGSAPFPEAPVVNHLPGDPVTPGNLVTLTSVVIDPPFPQADTVTTIDAGDTMVGDTVNGGFGIRNFGTAPLRVTNITISGADAPLFTIGSSCVNSDIGVGLACRESLDFSPLALASSIDATLHVFSNDPYNPVLDIPIRGTVSSDRDGVTDAVEGLAPNGGDFNRDGIPDSVQSNVASLPNINGDYVSIETEPALWLSNVSARNNPSPLNTPSVDGQGLLDFKLGFFSFDIEGLPAGSSATATLHLPAGTAVNSYFKYGVSPASPLLASWYRFDFDGQTGAEFRDGRIVLHFVDGSRGDSSLNPDGRIVDPGGPTQIDSLGASASSGGGGGCTPATGGETSQGPHDLALLLATTLLWRLRRGARRR